MIKQFETGYDVEMQHDVWWVGAHTNKKSSQQPWYAIRMKWFARFFPLSFSKVRNLI